MELRMKKTKFPTFAAIQENVKQDGEKSFYEIIAENIFVTFLLGAHEGYNGLCFWLEFENCATSFDFTKEGYAKAKKKFVKVTNTLFYDFIGDFVEVLPN